MQDASDVAVNMARSANGLAVEISQIPKVSKAAELGLKALSIAGNMIAFMAISKGIQLVINGLDELITTSEEAKEKADGFINSLKTFNEETSSNKKTLSELQSKYEEYSEGVSKTGENLHLTVDEYKEYKDIVSQISNILPDLTTYYNAQGEAIGFTQGKLADLNAEYDKYLQKEALDFWVNGDEDGNTIQDIVDNFNNYSNLGKIDTLGYSLKLLVPGLADLSDDRSIIDLKELVENATSMTQQELADYLEYEGGHNALVLQDVFGFTGDDIEEMSDRKFKDFQDEMRLVVQNYEDQLEAGYQDIKDIIATGIMKEDEYIDLSDEARTALGNYLSNMSSDFLKAFDIADIENGELSVNDIQFFMNKLLSNFSDETFTDAINNMFSIDYGSTEKTVAELQSEVDKYMSMILAKTQIKERIVALLKDSGIDESKITDDLIDSALKESPIFKGAYESYMSMFGLNSNGTNENVDATVNAVAEKFGLAYEELINNFSLPELEIAYDISSEEMDKALEQEKNKIKSELESLSKEGNVDLTIRPVIDSFTMQDVGWDVEDGSIATTFTQGEFIWQGNEENGQYVYVHYTPILPDGTVLTPNELTDYLYGTLEGSQSILDADNKGVVLKVDTDLNIPEGDIEKFTNGEGSTDAIDGLIQKTGEWDDKVHGVQEQYYDTGEGIGYAINALDGLIEKHKQLENPVLSFSDLFNADSIDDTKQKLLDLATSGELSAETITSTEEYKELLDQTDMSAQEFVDAIERFNIDNLNASFKKYNEVLQNVRNGQTLSAKEIASYIAENEELANAVIVTNGAYSLEEDALTSLINKYIETSNIAISNQIEASRRIVDSVKTRISAYNSEMVSLETLTTLTKIWEVSGGSQTAVGQYLYNNFGGTNATSYVPEIVKIIEARKKLDELLKELDESLENGNKNSSDSSSTFDWIDTQISNMEDSLSKLDNQVSNTYSKWDARNQKLAESIAKTNEAIVLQENAKQAYLDEANKITFSDSEKKYVTLVQTGDLKIDDIDNKDLADRISEYQDLYEKSIQCTEKADELRRTMKELETSEAWDLFKAESDADIELFDKQIDSYQTALDKLDLNGMFANESYYNDMVDLTQSKIASLRSQYTELQSIIAKVSPDSEVHDSMSAELQDIQNQIAELENECIEFYNNIRNLNWDIFEFFEESVSRVSEEINFLKDLLSDKDMFDDNGNMTKYADATMGLHFANIEVYKKQAEDYYDKMQELQEQLNNGAGDEVLQQYRDYEDAHRDAISSIRDEQNAILDLVENGYNAQLDALNEIIDKKKEALSAEKSLYDYQQSIQEKTDKVSSLQRQYDVYSNDTSEEGLAQAQKIKVELESAKADLEQTEYEKMISDQEKMLDALSD